MLLGVGDRAGITQAAGRRGDTALREVGDERATSARAIRPEASRMMKLCFPSTMWEPFCSVPPVGTITERVPACTRAATSVQVSSWTNTVSGPVEASAGAGTVSWAGAAMGARRVAAKRRMSGIRGRAQRSDRTTAEPPSEAVPSYASARLRRAMPAPIKPKPQDELFGRLGRPSMRRCVAFVTGGCHNPIYGIRADSGALSRREASSRTTQTPRHSPRTRAPRTTRNCWQSPPPAG